MVNSILWTSMQYIAATYLCADAIFFLYFSLSHSTFAACHIYVARSVCFFFSIGFSMWCTFVFSPFNFIFARSIACISTFIDILFYYCRCLLTNCRFSAPPILMIRFWFLFEMFGLSSFAYTSKFLTRSFFFICCSFRHKIKLLYRSSCHIHFTSHIWCVYTWPLVTVALGQSSIHFMNEIIGWLELFVRFCYCF